MPSPDAPSERPHADVEVDAVGLACPRPVIELAKAVREAEVGTLVRLRADDPAADVDVPVWCRMQRQRLVTKRSEGSVLVFDVEKISPLRSTET